LSWIGEERSIARTIVLSRSGQALFNVPLLSYGTLFSFPYSRFLIIERLVEKTKMLVPEYTVCVCRAASQTCPSSSSDTTNLSNDFRGGTERSGSLARRDSDDDIDWWSIVQKHRAFISWWKRAALELLYTLRQTAVAVQSAKEVFIGMCFTRRVFLGLVS
jgi:hypothetical protein